MRVLYRFGLVFTGLEPRIDGLAFCVTRRGIGCLGFLWLILVCFVLSYGLGFRVEDDSLIPEEETGMTC